ncbi:MAG: acetate--CoA ligase [Betaproteobacteria bacterium]|nr:acetate--CoA ligase [Betaproteobacteria bacterium]
MIFNQRVVQPSAKFAQQANLNKEHHSKLLHSALDNYEKHWAELAQKHIHWKKTFTIPMKWNPPFVEWFVDGELNISEQCLDRHLNGSVANKTALIWEGEPCNGLEPLERKILSYHELHAEVCAFAEGLVRLGVRRGDRVALYMPMIPEAVVAMLACARIGATHTVVFGGFSAESLCDRILDAQAKCVITANGGFRRGKILSLKQAVDKAVAECPCVENVVVVDRLGETGSGNYPKSTTSFSPTQMLTGRDRWYHDVRVAGSSHAAESLPAEHPLFILYTSGTTGKPKGVVHGTAGYALWTNLTCQWVFDIKPDDVYWCTADIGWVTGHSYVVYGPLSTGATVYMYEGAPDFPDFGRFWRCIEREKISIFYTAPTAIRAFMRQGEHWPAKSNLSTLRLLGSVGEPINPEAWEWYHSVIGQSQCPIVDTWWQTETGGVMMSPLPGLTPLKPGSATRPLPGIAVDVVDDAGSPVAKGNRGKLVITKPWPSQLRTVHGDPERYAKTYWSTFAGPAGMQKEPYYFTGDGAFKDHDGDIWVIGRVDDVINVAGHRIGTMEVESALVDHHCVAESAVVGIPDALKGTAVYAFVTLKNEVKQAPDWNDERKHALARELITHVGGIIGSFAKPDHIRFTDSLPKTRSGKIMRRLLRDVATGHESLGDTTTLEDVSVLATLRQSSDDE